METILHTHPNDDWDILFSCGGCLPRAPTRLQIDWDWKDQGIGDRKGCLKLDLLRSDQEVASIDLNLGHAAPHKWEHRTDVVEDGDFLGSFQKGDSLRVQRVVGGGGGHELYVTNFRIGFGHIGDMMDENQLVALAEIRKIVDPVSFIRGSRVKSSLLCASKVL